MFADPVVAIVPERHDDDVTPVAVVAAVGVGDESREKRMRSGLLDFTLAVPSRPIEFLDGHRPPAQPASSSWATLLLLLTLLLKLFLPLSRLALFLKCEKKLSFGDVSVDGAAAAYTPPLAVPAADTEGEPE